MNDISEKILIKLGRMKKSAEVKAAIRKRWTPTAVFTGYLHPGKEKRVSQADLLPGELVAFTFQVGCYTVRGAYRVFKICEPSYVPELETPADQADVELVKKDVFKNVIKPKDMDAHLMMEFGIPISCGFTEWRNRLRVTLEISARHNNSSNGDFICICRAAEARNLQWCEKIEGICAAKEHPFVSDEKASLFVCNTYMGNAFSFETWHKLDPHGTIKTLRLHPFDSEQEKARFQ